MSWILSSVQAQEAGEAAAHAEHAAHSFLGLGPEAWVAVGILSFFAILLYIKVPAMIGKMLDDKIASVRAPLDEAERLRADAEALKAEYESRRGQAEADAAAIIAQARQEAETLLAEAKIKLEQTLERREQSAQAKIASAQSQAVSALRGSITDQAVAAAVRLMQERLPAENRDRLVDEAIGDLDRRLH